MKTKLFFFLSILVLLSSCSFGGGSTTDYQPTITSYAVEVTTLTRDLADVTTENQQLKDTNADLTSQIADLEDQLEVLTGNAENTGSLDSKIQGLEDDLATATAESEYAIGMASDLVDLFVGEYGDVIGSFVLCEDAYDVSFGYVDRVSMRSQLVDYVKKFSADMDFELNLATLTSEHQQIWTDYQDAFVKVYDGEVLFPFIITFYDGEYGMQNSVYFVRYQCFLDFPALEANFASIVE